MPTTKQGLNESIKARGIKVSPSCHIHKIKRRLFVYKDGKTYYIKFSPEWEKISKKIKDLTLKEFEAIQQIFNTSFNGEAESIEEEKEWIERVYKNNKWLRFPAINNIEFECKLSVGSVNKKELVLVRPYTLDNLTRLCFFGEQLPQYAKTIPNEELSAGFYQYSTIVNGVEYVLFSENQIEESIVKIKGTLLTAFDREKISTQSHFETTKKNFVFVNEIEDQSLNIREIKACYNKINSVEELTEHYFGIFKHPEKLQKIILSWNIHFVPKDDYPLHLNILSFGGLGKTSLLERIALVNGLTSLDIFSGTQNTPKGLYPSFKGDKAKAGFLLEQPFVALLDEIYEMLNKVQRQTEKDEFFNKLRELYEGKLRVLKSGNTEDSISQPTFRAIAVGNPPLVKSDFSGKQNYATNMKMLVKGVDNPWLMRNLTVFYTEEHKKMIEQNKTIIERLKNKEGKKLEIKLASYLKALSEVEVVFSEENEKKLDELFLYPLRHHKLKDVLKREVKEIYYQRFFHHLRCLADGVMKLNHLKEVNSMLPRLLKNRKNGMKIRLEFTEKDFEDLKKLIEYMICSWFEYLQAREETPETLKKYTTTLKSIEKSISYLAV